MDEKIKLFQNTNLRKKLKKKISSQEAKKKGLATYFTGIPCLRGHVSERYISNRRCVDCAFIFYPRYKKKHSKTKKAKNTAAKRWKRYYASKNGKAISIKAQVKYQKKRRKNDPSFKLIFNLRSRFHSYLKQKDSKKISSITKLIGCSPKELKKYLEKKFIEEMNWKNHGTLWHIDHIFPMKAFDVKNIEELKMCFNYRNLQPLEKNKNWKKNDSFSEHDFKKFKNKMKKLI